METRLSGSRLQYTLIQYNTLFCHYNKVRSLNTDQIRLGLLGDKIYQIENPVGNLLGTNTNLAVSRIQNTDRGGGIQIQARVSKC